MSVRILLRCGALTVSLAAVGASAAIASSGPPYCDPLGGCPTHRLNVSPGTVKAGHTVRLHGTVGHAGCKTPGQVTIYSRAFKGATTRSFAGVPAVYARANKSGAFSKKVTIKRRIKPGKYHVGGRCGGGNFGSAKLRVK